MQIIERQNLEHLFRVLSEQGHTLLGPTVRDNAIVYAELSTVADLPQGWTDEQDGGKYRLSHSDDDTYFDYVVGPDSWKSWLFNKEEILYSSSVSDGQLLFSTANPDPAELPLPNITVVVTDSNTSQSLTTDATGRYMVADVEEDTTAAPLVGRLDTGRGADRFPKRAAHWHAAPFRP